MFRGLNALNLDGKGRLAIPARYREPIVARCTGQMVVTVDPDRCLLLYPLPDWLEIEQELIALPNSKPYARRMQRLLIGHAAECELDGSGRILLPPLLREYAQLDKAVVLIGQGKKFEIWNEHEWNTRRAEWLEAAPSDEELSSEFGSLSL